MEDSVGMAKSDPLDQLAHELFHNRTAQAVSRRLPTLGNIFHALLPIHLHVLFEIHVQELEDEIELVSVGVNDVQETDNGRVLHLFEEGDLPDGCTWDAFIFCFKADLLEGDDSRGMGEVSGFVHDTICTCADGHLQYN